MSALDALREATAALLEARGAAAEARLVRTGGLALLEGGRRWSVGSREVDALAFELALDPADHVALQRLPGGAERVRDALGDAVSGPTAMLADLFVVVRLPAIGAGWGAVYRSAPRQAAEPAVDERSVAVAAAELLRAEGHPRAAELLEEGELASFIVPSSGAVALRRWVLRLRPEAAAEARRGRAEEAIRQAVTAAATRAAEAVAGVELALSGTPRGR